MKIVDFEHVIACMVIKRRIQGTDIYPLKVNNRNTRIRSEICSKLTIKTPERAPWRRSIISVVNFEQISNLVIVFLLLHLRR